MRTMKRIVWNILWLCLLALPVTGCWKRQGTTTTLAEAEALMYTSPDSALQMLETIPHPELLTGQIQADNGKEFLGTSGNSEELEISFYFC